MVEKTKIFLSNLSQDEHQNKLDYLLQHFNNTRQTDHNVICAIENISPHFKERLIKEWSINPQFFQDHEHNPDKTTLWERQRWNLPTDADLARSQTHPWEQLRGISEYPDPALSVEVLRARDPNYHRRSIFQTGSWPINVSTTISYYKVTRKFYLFLVDAPIEYPTRDGARASNLLPTLRFPYSGNRGGLMVPRLPWSRTCAPMDMLVNAFAHKWQVDLVFNPSHVFPKVPMLYILAHSICETNYRNLDKRIKVLCLQEIRDPRIELVESLHDLREDLSTLRTLIEETSFYTERNVQEYFLSLRIADESINMRQTPVEGNQAIKEKADRLNTFFMENIQVLLGIISIQETQYSIRQTNQGMFLTVLAAIYLPLSLATGIFGMNIREMTGSGPHVWIFAIVCIILFALTLLAVFLASHQTIRDTWKQIRKAYKSLSTDNEKLLTDLRV